MARNSALRPAGIGVVLLVSVLMLTVVRPVLAGSSSSGYSGELAKARIATMKYANGIAQAKKDGYMIITKDIAGMGWHFLNPNITKFDVAKPMILVYEHTGNRWTLGALEWVFPSVPNSPPLRDATYGSFPAACHYKDGSFVPAAAQSDCPTHAPGSTAAFTFWHPPLFTMHLWLWYANPAGLYSGTNPLVAPFNS